MKKETESTPPRNFTRFFKWFCRADYYEDIQGDLEEEYYLLYQSGHSTKAKNWYRKQILWLFKPSMIKETKIQKIINNYIIMFSNHLKIGFRNLVKYKTGTAINIAGLAIGISAFILISLFIKDELSYDQHHQHADDIYRVTNTYAESRGGDKQQFTYASAGQASRLKEDYPSITHAARFFLFIYPDLQFADQKLSNQEVIFADPDVFDIFDFPFILGNAATAFANTYSIVLTEASAVRIFGSDWLELDIIGESLVLTRGEETGPFKITGVMKDMPDQQHFHFEYLAPMRFLEQIFPASEMNRTMGNYNWPTYVRFVPGTDVKDFESKTGAFFDKHVTSKENASDFYSFIFQPLKDIHLHSNLSQEIEQNGSIQQVYIFGVVAILLLLVACVNYMNLATSHYSRRMKEVGVRKVLGASKNTLVTQFLTESLLITTFSIPVAILLVILGLPYINGFSDKNLTFDIIQNIGLLLGLISLTLFIGIVAGLYPALFLSKIDLTRSLKGESAIRSSKWNFRNWLVTFQYSVTIALIFSILVIENQMQFIQNKDLGFDRKQIVNVSMSRKVKNIDRYKWEMLEHPNITLASYSSRVPSEEQLLDNMGAKYYKGDSLTAIDFRLPCISIDEDFVDTFGLDILAGENFSSHIDMMTDSVGYFIVNRKTAETLGYQNPRDIVGTNLVYGPNEGKIQAVVEDFHFESLHGSIKPMIMLRTSQNNRRLSLKIKSDDIRETLSHIEKVHASFDGESPVHYKFVDEYFEDQYRHETQLATMVKVFTVIAIFIACLGLIGMVSFIIETKIKEIGIRKSLGASVKGLLLLISNQFFVLISIAFVVTLPAAYWLMDGWLQNFEYRSHISLLIIAMPLILTALFTVVTVGYQSIKATQVNPVDILKNE